MAEYLFTLVCDFDGGTYVSQVRASNERYAVSEWAALLRREQPIGDASLRIANEVIERSEAPQALDGLKGVWCWSAIVDDKLVLTNIVRSP